MTSAKIPIGSLLCACLLCVLLAVLRLALVFGLVCCAKFTRQADFPSESILCLGKNETIYSEKLCLGVEDTGVSFYTERRVMLAVGGFSLWFTL